MAISYVPDSIRSKCVAPGLVATKMVQSYLVERGNPHRQDESRYVMSPLGRAAHPDEIASGCLFLASDEASYVNGAILVIDGGSSA